MTATMALRPYQEQAYETIVDGLARGVRRPLLELPTGAGKTVIFATLIVRRGGTALVIAHRDELLDQAADKLTQVDPTLGLSIGFVAGKANEWGAPIVIASAQTLASTRRLAQLPRTFTTAIIDEAHHAVAAGYKRVLDHLTDVDLIAGVTATATRADGKDLSEVWDEVVFRRTIVEMIQDGYLCDVRGVRVSVNARLDDIRLSAGDLDADALGAALTDASAPAHIVAAYQQHAAGRRSILFVPTVALAHTTASLLRAAGITAEALDGSTDPVTRKQMIDRLHSGKTMVLSNVAVLTEGVDVPCVDCVIMATPTKSKILYTQCVGRGLRLHPGKQDLLVLDVVGVTERLALQTFPGLFGLTTMPGLTTTVTAAQRASAASAPDELADVTAAADTTSATAVDMLSGAPAAGLHWLRHGEAWLVAAGRAGVIALVPGDRGRWQVLRGSGDSQDRIAGGVELGDAQGIAHEYLNHLGVARLADPEASWRAASATSAQRGVLARLGVSAPEHASRGEASDLIVLTQGARALMRALRAA